MKTLNKIGFYALAFMVGMMAGTAKVQANEEITSKIHYRTCFDNYVDKKRIKKALTRRAAYLQTKVSGLDLSARAFLCDNYHKSSGSYSLIALAPSFRSEYIP